jgi:hypothetical protein
LYLSLRTQASVLPRPSSIEKRDRVVEEFKINALPNDIFLGRYFGEKLLSGHMHREYADLVDVIHSYTNDLIFFSSQLSEELAAHGQALATVFTKKFGKGAPTVSNPDFTGPKKSGLFPPHDDYSSWLNWIVDESPSNTIVAKK